MAATPSSAATLSSFLVARGFTCNDADIAPAVGGTVGPYVIGQDPSGRHFVIAWGTVALPIVKAAVDLFLAAGFKTLLANYTATEICVASASATSVYPLVTTTPDVAISTDDAGLINDIFHNLAINVAPNAMAG